jgi:hypothetical protein
MLRPVFGGALMMTPPPPPPTQRLSSSLYPSRKVVLFTTLRAPVLIFIGYCSLRVAVLGLAGLSFSAAARYPHTHRTGPPVLFRALNRDRAGLPTHKNSPEIAHAKKNYGGFKRPNAISFSINETCLRVEQKKKRKTLQNYEVRDKVFREELGNS